MNHTIALCDILGFSELVANQTLDDVVQKPLTWVRRSLHRAVHQGADATEKPSLQDIQGQDKLGVAWFSDTILLYTLKDEDECIKLLLQAVGWLLFERMFSPYARIRGGIAYGEAHLDASQSIFVGKPIIEAYLSERRQAWSGCCIAESACARIPKWVQGGQRPDWWLRRYPVPLNEQPAKEMLVVDWTRGIHDLYDFPWSSKSPIPSHEDERSMPDVCEKWRNTKQFHREVCEWCQPLLEQHWLVLKLASGPQNFRPISVSKWERMLAFEKGLWIVIKQCDTREEAMAAINGLRTIGEEKGVGSVQ